MLERPKDLEGKEKALDPKQRSLQKPKDFSPTEERELKGAIRRLAKFTAPRLGASSRTVRGA
jgi:hypothetical protein